jgi:hypothetical protein
MLGELGLNVSSLAVGTAIDPSEFKAKNIILAVDVATFTDTPRRT